MKKNSEEYITKKIDAVVELTPGKISHVGYDHNYSKSFWKTYNIPQEDNIFFLLNGKVFSPRDSSPVSRPQLEPLISKPPPPYEELCQL